MTLATPAPRRASSRAAAHRADSNNNVARVERVGSVALGSALLTYGVRRRDAAGAVAALVGGVFLMRGATGHCPLYQALGVSTGSADPVLGGGRDDLTGLAATVNARKAVKVERSVTIEADREMLYAFWRDFENLPHFMEHLVSVRTQSRMRSHWVAKAPAGTTVEWDAEIVNEIPGELIAWKSVSGAEVPNAGSVHFTDAPGDRGTVVRVVLDAEPPAGKLGYLLAKLFGEDPDQQVRDDLRKFKQLMERGVLRP